MLLSQFIIFLKKLYYGAVDMHIGNGNVVTFTFS